VFLTLVGFLPFNSKFLGLRVSFVSDKSFFTLKIGLKKKCHFFLQEKRNAFMYEKNKKEVLFYSKSKKFLSFKRITEKKEINL